jgi:hypothetical protein
VAFASLTCPACGAREIVRKDRRFACAYCKAMVVPRLQPGTLCEDAAGARHCGKPAQTLCKGCARPLCDRHNDPKAVYWHEPLHWKSLCPCWAPQEGAEWERLVRPFQRLPLEGFAPFQWTPHDRNAQYQLGLLEGEVFERVKAAARAAGGDCDEQAARFESLCSECESETAQAICKAAVEFAPRYTERAYRERLSALHAETEQGIRYVEAFLRRPILSRMLAPDGPVSGLGLDSPKQDWDRLGQELRQRLSVIVRLEEALGVTPRREARS